MYKMRAKDTYHGERLLVEIEYQQYRKITFSTLYRDNDNAKFFSMRIWRKVDPIWLDYKSTGHPSSERDSTSATNWLPTKQGIFVRYDFFKDKILPVLVEIVNKESSIDLAESNDKSE